MAFSLHIPSCIYPQDLLPLETFVELDFVARRRLRPNLTSVFRHCK